MRSSRANGILAVLGDRPVAYHPALARILGVKEAVFACQLLYWDGKGSDPEGWIYKTQVEWTEETGLSRYEQETVRKNLRDRGILHEKLKGVPARLYYKLDFDVLAAAIDEAYPETDPVLPFAETPQPSLQKPRKLASAIPAGKPAETPPAISETTPETTRDYPIPEPAPERVVIDLDELIEGSNAGYRRHEYTAQCPHCGASIGQAHAACPGCQAETVWLNSATWRKLWGRPEDALRESYAPDGRSGEYLTRKATEGSQEPPWVEFSNKRDFLAWQKAVASMVNGHDNAIRWIDYWFNAGKRGRGLVAATLNSVKKYPAGPADIGPRRSAGREIETYGSIQ